MLPESLTRKQDLSYQIPVNNKVLLPICEIKVKCTVINHQQILKGQQRNLSVAGQESL